MKSRKRVCYGVLPVTAALGRRLREEWSVVEGPGRERERRDHLAAARSRKETRRGAE